MMNHNRLQPRHGRQTFQISINPVYWSSRFKKDYLTIKLISRFDRENKIQIGIHDKNQSTKVRYSISKKSYQKTEQDLSSARLKTPNFANFLYRCFSTSTFEADEYR